MSGRLPLAKVATRKAPGYAENHQSVLMEPDYGQLDYMAPVLLCLAREYRKPIYQHLALWDSGLGSIQKSRYITPHGEHMLFDFGGYVYAWYDPSVPDEVDAGLPLAFDFPETHEAYVRTGYRPDGLLAGYWQGVVAVHAGGRPVLIEWVNPPPASDPTREVTLAETGTTSVIRCLAVANAAFVEQTVTLERPKRCTIARKTGVEMRWWCHGAPVREGNTVRWPDGTQLLVTRGALTAWDPIGYSDEKIVGMGKLKCVDPLPMRYPLATARPDAGELVIEITTP
jgi:hypothetical protein